MRNLEGMRAKNVRHPLDATVSMTTTKHAVLFAFVKTSQHTYHTYICISYDTCMYIHNICIE